MDKRTHVVALEAELPAFPDTLSFGHVSHAVALVPTLTEAVIDRVCGFHGLNCDAVRCAGLVMASCRCAK